MTKRTKPAAPPTLDPSPPQPECPTSDAQNIAATIPYMEILLLIEAYRTRILQHARDIQRDMSDPTRLPAPLNDVIPKCTAGSIVSIFDRLETLYEARSISQSNSPF